MIFLPFLTIKVKKFELKDLIGDFDRDPDTGDVLIKRSKDGNLRDKKGKLVNKRGYLIDSDGNIIDKK